MGQIKGLLVAVVIVSGIVLGISAFYADIGIKYGATTTNSAFLNRSVQIAGTLESIGNRTAAPTSDAEVGAFLAFGALNTIKLTGQSVGIVSGLVGDANNPQVMGTAIPIPEWVGDVVTALLVIIVIVGIAIAWLKWDL